MDPRSSVSVGDTTLRSLRIEWKSINKSTKYCFFILRSSVFNVYNEDAKSFLTLEF